MKTHSIGSPILTCLILTSWLGIGRSAPNSAAEADGQEVANPLVRMLGLTEPLLPDMADTASEIADSIEEQKQMMERAMDSQRNAMRLQADTIDKVMDDQTKHMDLLMDFDKEFENFDKHFDDFNKRMEDEFDRLSEPLRLRPADHDSEAMVQLGTPSQTKPSNSSAEEEPAHDLISSFITSLIDPVIQDLQKDIEKSANESFDAEKQRTESSASQAVVDQDFELLDNQTDVNATKGEGGIVADFLGTIVGSLADIFSQNDGNESNETAKSITDLDNFDQLYEKMHSEDKHCGCPEAHLGIHMDNCPMKEMWKGTQELHKELATSTPSSRFEDDEVLAGELQEMADAIDQYRDGGPLPVKSDRLNALNKLIEIENRLEARFRREWNVDDQPSAGPLATNGITIEQKLRHDIHIVAKDDNHYEWYDWALVGLITATSTLLFAIALVMAIQKVRRAKRGKATLQRLELADQTDGIANDNVGNKYKEKIKTIFVNMQ